MEFFRLMPTLGKRRDEIFANWQANYWPVHGDPPAEMLMRSCLLAEGIAHAEAGWPYYKVWPDYLDMFRKTRLDNIPATAMRFPFAAWNILLPTDYRLPALHGYVASLSVFCTTRRERAELLLKTLGATAQALPPCQEPLGRVIAITISVVDPDTAERHQASLVLEPDHILAAHPDYTVEELLQTAVRNNCRRPTFTLSDAPIDEWTATLLSAMRVIMSVAFIATGEYKFVNRDVLTADALKYREAVGRGDTATADRLADKAVRRRGETGYTIGKFHAIDLLAQRTEPVAGESEEQRELRHQHLRSGHFHAYWCGPGRTERKVRFLVPVVVRPDLPPVSHTPARLIR